MPSDHERLWSQALAEMRLTPELDLLEVRVEGKAPELRVTIVSLADEELAFSDGLYGTAAYAFTGERWRRVDTADIRAQIAPLLAPEQEATFRLPVKAAAGFYRVLVPVQGKADWGDSG